MCRINGTHILLVNKQSCQSIGWHCSDTHKMGFTLEPSDVEVLAKLIPVYKKPAMHVIFMIAMKESEAGKGYM